MVNAVTSQTFTGGCHCGDVRFEVDADLDPRTQMKLLDCNCSMCTKKGIVHLMVPASHFRLLTPVEAITTYTFNTHVAKHTFCKRCGIHSFYTPRSHPDHVDVNVRCLDGVDPWALHVERFDGANWEANVATIRDEKGDHSAGQTRSSVASQSVKRAALD